jgi:hypothetical protein
MRVFDNGSMFTVSYSPSDCEAFAHGRAGTWPCSTVKGRGSFTFDKSNGDLVDASGSATRGDGLDWLAFSRDCQDYGTMRLEGVIIAHVTKTLFERSGVRY